MYNIVITGASSGIGKELAISLSKNNNVIICGRNKKKLSAVAKNTNLDFFKCNTSVENDVLKFKKYLKSNYKYIDVIINNAAIQEKPNLFFKTSTKEWTETFNNNLLSTYLSSKHLLELLLKSKIKKIINFAGGGAFDIFPYFSSYASSKAAIVRFTENIDNELKKLKINVTAIAPGFVVTPIHKKVLKYGKSTSGEYFKFVKNKIKKGSVPIKDVVHCVEFIINCKSKSINGITISVSFDKWKDKEFVKLLEKNKNSNFLKLRRINPQNIKYDKRLSRSINKLYKNNE